MKLKVRLFENPASTALNTVAHAVEHCAVDPATLDALDSAVGRQLLVRLSGSLALYTVVASDGVARCSVQVGTGGRARLGNGPTGAPLRTLLARIIDVAPSRFPLPCAARILTASVESDFTQGQAATRLTEEVLGDDGTGLAILAPHGGGIEPHTDEQAESVYGALAQESSSVRAWIARGFNESGAHKCWHITTSEMSEHSFPRLGSFFPIGPRGAFAHAVAFHGNNDCDDVLVGGGLPRDSGHTALKTELCSRIRNALSKVTAKPPKVVVTLCGPLAGVQRSNIVNRVTARGNGIQLEQPLGVREDPEQREAVVRAVAELYVDRL